MSRVNTWLTLIRPPNVKSDIIHQNHHFSVMAEPTCQGDRKWMRKEAVMIDAPKEIEEKEGLPPIMVMKGEV